MANFRTPLAKAKLSGAVSKNPQRYRGRAEPATSGNPVGDPPTHLSKGAKTAWKEAADILNWLVVEDRLALEIAAQAITAIRETAASGEPIRAGQLTAARQALASLGATPADRSKIHVLDEVEHDPFAQFAT